VTLHSNQFFPTLYDIVRKKSAIVTSVLQPNPLNIYFRRHLVGINLIAWQRLMAKVREIQLTGRRDTFIWPLQQNGKYTAHSMYRALVVPNILPHNHPIWKLKLPLKVKVFIWYLRKGVVLTKNNLAKRRWKGSLKCCYCNMDESIQHLFFNCPYARLVWKIIQVSFNISPLLNMHHMFNGWVQGIYKKLMYKTLIVARTLCWATWLSRKNVVFDKV
jgi:hypothetical protein